LLRVQIIVRSRDEFYAVKTALRFQFQFHLFLYIYQAQKKREHDNCAPLLVVCVCDSLGLESPCHHLVVQVTVLCVHRDTIAHKLLTDLARETKPSLSLSL